ncbi:hypothetical protein [Azovibrio restrictus]|uniref:hypothetical protein n=1 Tax=Azovibrio restrictus TaxID=146938 RepID=UPI0026F0690B|nr:hypothetical protein [Azovibrio restrictus]MDD3483063.1 hypothetical protein [Azovibrio restrictus]
MNAYTFTGLLLSLAGSTAIYLASPNQRWRQHPLPRRSARLLGILLLTLGCFSLTRVLQPLTTSFVFITWLMLVFTLLPYIGALARQAGES